MYNALTDTGFVFNENSYGQDILKIYNDHEKSARKIVFDKKSYMVLDIDDNIEFWIPVIQGKRLNIYNYSIHYNTDKEIDILNPHVEFRSRDGMFALVCADLAEAPVRFNVAIPNARCLPKLRNRKKPYKCQIACFAENFSCYKSEEDFHKEYKNWNKNSFFPTGQFSPDIHPDAPESARALINGTVQSIETKTNAYTENEFYHVVLGFFNVTFDVFIRKTSESQKIAVGDILSVDVWLSAKITAGN